MDTAIGQLKLNLKQDITRKLGSVSKFVEIEINKIQRSIENMLDPKIVLINVGG